MENGEDSKPKTVQIVAVIDLVSHDYQIKFVATLSVQFKEN
jgi:hypothetical protein